MPKKVGRNGCFFSTEAMGLVRFVLFIQKYEMGKNGKAPKFSVKSKVGLLFGILVIVLEILKNVTKSGKSPKGGGVSRKNQKVQIFEIWTF